MRRYWIDALCFHVQEWDERMCMICSVFLDYQSSVFISKSSIFRLEPAALPQQLPPPPVPLCAALWRMPRGRAMWRNLLHTRHHRSSMARCRNQAQHLQHRRLSRWNSGRKKRHRWKSSLRPSGRGARTLPLTTTRRNRTRSRSQQSGVGQAGKSGRPHVWKRNTGARSSVCCRTMRSCMKQPCA